MTSINEVDAKLAEAVRKEMQKRLKSGKGCINCLRLIPQGTNYCALCEECKDNPEKLKIRKSYEFKRHLYAARKHLINPK